MTGRTDQGVLSELLPESAMLTPARNPPVEELALRSEFSLTPPFQHRGIRMLDDWPLSSYLELGALAGAVPCARLHARYIAQEWGLSELGETLELLVSELTTNAVHASQAMQRDLPVRFWLLSDKARILILLWDGNPSGPARKIVNEDAENGRGLVLVDALSVQWSWYAHPQFGGKVVWCEIAAGDLSDWH